MIDCKKTFESGTSWEWLGNPRSTWDEGLLKSEKVRFPSLQKNEPKAMK